MFFDLNVPVVAHHSHGAAPLSKKNKGKQPQVTATVVFTPAQIAAIEARTNLLVHCQSFAAFFHLSLTFRSAVGYTVIAFNQTVEKKIDPKTHLNILNALLPQLKHRTRGRVSEAIDDQH